MENKNDRYDLSYFEDDRPYVSHRDRASSDERRSAKARLSRPERRADTQRPIRKELYPTGKRKRRITKGRVILVGFAAAVLALIVGIIVLISVIHNAALSSALTVSDVTADSVTLSWKQKNDIEGYRIYCKPENSKNYELAQSVDDPGVISATVSSLEQAGEYDFYITAVKNNADSGKFGRADNICTLPSPPPVSLLDSQTEGGLHIEWTVNDKADGYIVEYTKTNSGSAQPQTVVINNPQTSFCDIADLDAGENYTVRVYAYLKPKKADDALISPPGEEQSVKIARANVSFESGASFYDNTIDPDKPMVAFTFDDGPFDAVYSERILDTLEKYDAKATFFMVGCYVEDHPENLKRKVDLHMELGNHTWDHSKYGANIPAEDIRKCSDAIFEVTGQYPTAFRPPGGAEGGTISAECISEGMAIYLWNVNSEDYESHNADAIYQMVMDTLADGNIIGMHDTYEATAEAVERLVPEILAQGYQIVSCHDLVVAKTGKEPVAGDVYYRFSEDKQ